MAETPSDSNGGVAENSSADRPDAAVPTPQRQRLIILADGTWDDRLSISSGWHAGTNTSKPASDEYWTNVALLNFAIPPVSKPDKNGETWRQVCFYQSGIGTEQTTLLGRLFSGATGTTLADKVQEAYGWLSDNYHEGDEIFLFGFSRGAYTARCISGFVAWAGLLQKCADHNRVLGRPVNESIYFNEIFEAYSKRKPDDKESIKRAAQVLYDKVGRWPTTEADETSTAKKLRTAAGKAAGQQVSTEQTDRAEDGEVKKGAVTVPPTIKALGVWDTVGSLGVPGFFPQSTLYEFLDPGLSSNVSYAFQALALSEDRRDFMPTLWYKPWPSQEGPRRKGQVLKQAWFTGAHGNVGGSSNFHGLSDIALAWMVAQLVDTTAPEPLLDVDIDVIRSLQDRRSAWAKEAPLRTRSPIAWRQTRQVKAKPDADQRSDVEWKDNVYTGVTNEALHHSVIVSGRFTKDSPQFASLKKSHPELLDALWAHASDPESLSPTEKALMWKEPTPGQPPHQPPNAVANLFLRAVAFASTAAATVTSDIVNLRIIPANEQVNLKVPLAKWARQKLYGGNGL
ncbi:unnamed protein product [Parajaminaea phylloscopi]